MTSPSPLSSFVPICSYCLKESKSPLFFMYEEKERGYIDKKFHKQIHWACCEEHKKQILEDETKIINNPNILLKELIKMYVEIYDVYSKSKEPLFKKLIRLFKKQKEDSA